ncbi:MAG: hypothetical protein ACTHMY_07855 [Solirubrobacteraceae bacterium]
MGVVRADGLTEAHAGRAIQVIPAALSRRLVVAFIAGLIGIGLLYSSAEASTLSGTHRVQVATASLKTCPYLRRQLTAVGARNVSCKRADAVARAYVLGHHHPLGFHCREIPVYQHGVETNWYGRCRKGRAVVQFVPE